jgi:uncharacterized protein
MLPASISASELAELVARSAKRSFEFPVESCTRLAGLVADLPEARHAQVSAGLAFATSADGRPQLSLHLQAQLMLPCQRCLQPFTWLLDETVELELAGTEEQAQASTAPMDALVAGPEGLDLPTVLEDEIIAALPLSARHPAGATCAVVLPLVEAQEDEATPVRPFAGLSALLRQQRDD